MFRRLSEQDYYQVLEVEYDASPEEIQSAYEDAREIYSHEALVSVSILTEPERRKTYERIAEAYQTLIAEESRRLYDESLGIPCRSPARARLTVERRETPLILTSPLNPLDTEALAEADGALPESVPDPQMPERRSFEPRRNPLQLGMTEEATGEFLRRARESLGLDLSAISEETKIGGSMLEYIEAERLDRLPAPIYLKNFTLQIARCLGLDEEKVARTYLARIRRLQSQG
ncbi:MAG TPA: helix-turn-helix domain-containing protein [Vicinamibacteria bacterium]|nr:helix-turn-helix domain-containing protein [Vicinamibacteria bacterium]